MKKTRTHIYSLVVLFFFCISLLGCNQGKTETELNKEISEDTLYLGKYVYMSSYCILHTNKHCSGLLSKDIVGKRPIGVKFVDTSLICPNYEFWYCPKCFSDKQYKFINSIIERNKQEKEAQQDENNNNFSHTRKLLKEWGL